MTPTTALSLEERVRHATEANRARRGERIQSLWSGYGEVVRFYLEGASQPSAVVKHALPPPCSKPPQNGSSPTGHARKLRSYAVEQAFYQHWAPTLERAVCRVPHAFGVWGGQAGTARQPSDPPALSRAPGVPQSDEPARLEWLFVLEDLDASGFSLRCPKPTVAQQRACLHWLARFHAGFMAQPPRDLWPEGTYWHLATRPDEFARMKPGRLKSSAACLDARLSATRYPTLLHGDAKVANFCFATKVGQSAVAAVDFQYAGVGCGMKDVAYFFSSCLNARECAAQAPRLLDDYFVHLRAALAERGSTVDSRALEAEWRALYPLAWADFQRFLEGWAPDHSKLHGYCHSMTQVALSSL